jgi:phosphate transport system substrate-binding protein
MLKPKSYWKTVLFIVLFSGSYSCFAASEMQANVIHWAGCGITKKAFMAELAAAYEAKTGIKIDLQGGGATRGIRDTAKLKIDMGGTCRMTLPEVDKSEMHATLHPVAWDALAIIVHKSNPVNGLSSRQVKDIYEGKITNWKQVGGKNVPMELYVREGKISGVGYAIRQYLFENSDEEFVSDHVVKSSGPLEKAVEKRPNAIGITGISSARKRDVKVLGFDGKTPTYENVKNGQYGLYRPLYLVTSPAPSKVVKSFIEFAQSEEGKEILRKNKTVPYADALHLMRKMLIYGFGVQ